MKIAVTLESNKWNWNRHVACQTVTVEETASASGSGSTSHNNSAECMNLTCVVVTKAAFMITDIWCAF
jgi:hypothetical protein